MSNRLGLRFLKWRNRVRIKLYPRVNDEKEVEEDREYKEQIDKSLFSRQILNVILMLLECILYIYKISYHTKQSRMYIWRISQTMAMPLSVPIVNRPWKPLLSGLREIDEDFRLACIY